MSLDISLYGTSTEPCEHCGLTGGSREVYDANITHNLIAMAEEGDIYDCVWHPEENSIERAEQLIEPLSKAILAMKIDPPRFERHNSPNGWGLCKNFLPWLERLLAACREHPTAKVRVSR